MPALPWRSHAPIEGEQEYTVLASKLALRRLRSVPGFLAHTLAIQRQLDATDGLVGYSLDADLMHLVFWTFSVWANQASLDAFVTSDPHRQIMGSLQGHMKDTAFFNATFAGSDIPSSWTARKALLG
jgi:heme-degrading monooxygenase HmoA